MTSPAKNILIIGGGFSGMSAAIQLRKQGLNVDIVEIDPGWRSYGAGISLHGATLRAFGQLGVLDEFLKLGYGSDGAELRAPHDLHLAMLPTPRVAGADVPGAGAIMRPVLAKILADATRASGANVRLGTSFTAIQEEGEQVKVTFTDGTSAHYDLVIGADGLYSKVREALFPNAPKPQYSGQGVWRAVLPRLPEVERAIMWVGPKIKTGINPVSNDEIYLFITEDRASNDFIDPAEFVPRIKALLAPFPAPLMQWAHDQITADSQIVFRPLEGLLMPQPWFKGHTVLIGDAVHATTPHMAAGACIGIEDAMVLAEELGQAATVQEALQAFQARRWERCRMVVENSARLGVIEITGGDKAEHARIMGQSMMKLADPI